MSVPLRPDLTPPHARIAKLPIEDRGYPVPWFVPYIAGPTGVLAPEFRGMDAKKFRLAISDHLCWICGEKLGAYMTYVVGPMCIVNRTTVEPPSHSDCAKWAAINCPFLTRPHMVRREDEMTENAEAIGGIMIKRNPGATCLWTTKVRPELWFARDKPLIRMGTPTSVSWWRERREATRAEVLDSLRTGLPALMAMAVEQDREEGGPRSVEQLREQLWAAMGYLPGDPSQAVEEQAALTA